MRAWVRLADGREPDPFALLLFADVAAAHRVVDRADGLGADRAAAGARARAAGARAGAWWRRAPARSAGGWLDEDYRIWDSTGRLVAQSRQLARAPR